MFGVALVTWFAPALSAASTNALFRLRGELKPPEDVVIVSIDDLSLQRIGRWPWPRSVMADALDRISLEQPRAIGLDVIFAEPSSEVDDKQLQEAVKRSRRVVLPAQLIGTDGEGKSSDSVTWLRPVFKDVAATGHAHVAPDVDGILRSIQLSKADNQGIRLWAFSLEVLRVAETISDEDFVERPGILQFGPYDIVLREDGPSDPGVPGLQLNRQNEMLINYAGPAASFPRYSIVDLLDGKIPRGTLSEKIVLVGAVAPSMSDVGVSPFMNYGSNELYGGQEIPGVEVHANIIHTIRQRIWLKPVSETQALLISFGLVILTSLIISRLDGWQQVFSLGVVLLTILLGSFYAFKLFQIIPPIPAMLFAFASAVPLLLNRALNASRRLDLKLAVLAGTQKGFLLDENNDSSPPVTSSDWPDLPHDLGGKIRAVTDITTRLVSRMNFMDRVLSGMGEGVLVANNSGRIVFANDEAAQVFSTSSASLLSASFAETCVTGGIFFSESEFQEALKETMAGQIVQKDFTIQRAENRVHYALQLSAIMSTGNRENGSTTERSTVHDSSVSKREQVMGVVALITDTTRRVEREQIRMESLQLVSHELRTPLTSIQGLSDVLLKFPVETGQAQEMLATIHGESVRLNQTINRYLDIARLESGAQSLRLSPVELEPLIADCVRLHAPLALERGIRIVQKVDCAVGSLEADTQLLTQAVNNLLSNAIKYSSGNSEVSIQTESDRENVRIAVHDQGPGIPPQECERLFEKFYRLERDAASGVVGTGLGLPLVKEIVEKHGGTVHVASTPSVGSIFTIQLPREQQN
jgi:signal transduction histidine kinase/CHASE2 domain-containing sensor protein